MNRRNKYGAVRTEVDGIVFASRAEARHYGRLKILERAGEITDLELQPKYDLHVNGVKVAYYKADFRYVTRDGQTVVEDVKGVKTPVYRLKKKMLKAEYGIDIQEVR